jgi:hypothetical protein
MGKTIILTETQEQELLSYLITERRYPVEPHKVLLVKNYLDKNFKRGNIEKIGTSGLPENEPVVGLLSHNEVVKNLTAKQLFDLLEDEFRGMFTDKIQRSKFLTQVIKDWYNKRISKEGLLSTTYC